MVLVCTIGGAPAPDCAWLAAIFEANWTPDQLFGELNDRGGTALTPILTGSDNGGEKGGRKRKRRCSWNDAVAISRSGLACDQMTYSRVFLLRCNISKHILSL